MKLYNYSTVIIGSGISGLYTALKISENPNIQGDILLVTKSSIGESNSRYAQGGIVAVLPSNTADSIELHVKDTLKSGAGLTSFEVATEISKSSAEAIDNLIQYGVKFDKDDDNKNFSITLEGAHSARRILHSGGDATGRGIETALVEKVKQNKKIKVLENTFATELIKDNENKIRGVVLFNNNEYSIVYSSAIVLATGGLGQIFEYTTNPKIATADGISLALEAGAILQNMEFIQFHPTSISDEKSGHCFLISEAVRGEGAKLRNKKGELFAHKYDERADLASRDIVTRAIFTETNGNPSFNVFLDTTKIDYQKMKKRFPNITKACEEKGLDLTKDYIPITPAAHYSMGGIKAALSGITSLEGLYAVGETACTGLHGANRLASNSLLECVVGAHKLAEYLGTQDLSIKEIPVGDIIQKYTNNSIKNNIDVPTAKAALKRIMWLKAGICRNEKLMLEALNDIIEMESRFKSDICSTIEEYELKNMILASKAILISALNRKESRGGHYRSDYPETLPDGKQSYLTQKDIFNYVKLLTA